MSSLTLAVYLHATRRMEIEEAIQWLTRYDVLPEEEEELTSFEVNNIRGVPVAY